MAYACVESVLPSTGADLDMYRAVPREVHLPYFTNGNAMEPVPPPSAHPNPNPDPHPNPKPHPNPHPNQVYPYCPAWALPWNYRRRNILRELVAYHADIMCLQVTLTLTLTPNHVPAGQGLA